MIEEHLVPVDTYKEPHEFAERQAKLFWLPEEIKVEKDVHDILTNFSEAERHGVITTLKLFTLYETHAGDEYWGGRFKRIFNGAEFHRMAATFAFFELFVHEQFYDKINKLLHLNTRDFYLSYLDDPVLKDRIEHIGQIIDHPSDAVSLAGFAFVEGVVLYSSFAFLKHFQAGGKNKLANIDRGISFSVRDETIHYEASCWCYRLLTKDYTKEQKEEIETIIYEVAQKALEHEEQIIKKIFEHGRIEGITERALVNFVKSRIDECLSRLGMKTVHNVKASDNPIAKTFYQATTTYQFADMFAGQNSEYHRAWDETSFVWASK